jgi:hypothetical protein
VPYNIIGSDSNLNHHREVSYSSPPMCFVELISNGAAPFTHPSPMIVFDSLLAGKSAEDK